VRKLALFAMMTLLFCSRAVAQNSNSVTVQVVAPPSWTITVSPSNYYQSKAATMTITVSAGAVTNTCTATWDALPMSLSFPASLTPDPVALTGTVTAAMTATLGAHTVFITCPIPPLTLNTPVTLPNAKVGSSYSSDLAAVTHLSGGVTPYTWTLTSGSLLPPGLSLSSSGVLGGVPSSPGSANFSFTVKDSSGLAMRITPRLVSGGA
jgi:hypothetical protein